MARKSSHDRDALEAARRKKQEQYWADRAQSRVRANDRNADTVKAEQDKAYRDARDNVRREIDKFYRDFGNAAGMSAEEARQMLSRGELKDFKAELERKRKIIQEMIAKDPNNKALKRYDSEWENLSKVRELTRKEALEANITAEIAQIGGKQQMSMDSHLNKVIDTSLKMTADDLKKLGNVDVKLGVGSPEQVKRAAKENWQHSDFSDRIWADKEKLIKEAREVIENGFAHNKGAMDMATDLMVRMNVSHSNALRVVRTEFNHLSNQAALSEYKSSGIKKYKFVSAIDNRTCSVCHGLNGKEFLVSEAKTGVNFPPIHPNCRSVTVPVIDWGDKDQWDYSNIELDDAELAELGLTREDVKALDASAPELPKDAPKPTLTTREADKAANDTQSVKRRAEQAEKRAQIEIDFEVDARRQLEAIEQVKTKMDQLEDINRSLEKEGVPMTLPRAAIEAERLEEIGIDIKEQELEAVKLQERAARIDDTVPNPDENAVEQLKTAIEDAKTRRADRQKKDLPDAEIISQALSRIAVEKPEPTAEDAVAPQSKAGKLWARVKANVEKVRERFNDGIRGFVERISDDFVGFVDWLEGVFGVPQPAMAMAGGGGVPSKGILMTTGSTKQKETKPPYQPTHDELKKIDSITSLIEKANSERDGEPIIGKKKLLDENRDIITESPAPDSLSTARSIAQKLVTYSLNVNHPVGGNKAILFEALFGITVDNPHELVKLLVFDFENAAKGEKTENGQKYVLFTKINAISGEEKTVKSVWILNRDGILRLVSAYVV